MLTVCPLIGEPTEENCDDESDDNETNEREKLRLDNEHEVALSSIQVTSVFFSCPSEGGSKDKGEIDLKTLKGWLGQTGTVLWYKYDGTQGPSWYYSDVEPKWCTQSAKAKGKKKTQLGALWIKLDDGTDESHWPSSFDIEKYGNKKGSGIGGWLLVASK